MLSSLVFQWSVDRPRAVFLSALQVRKYLMKRMIHNSLKEMRELGARLIEIERIRSQLRRLTRPFFSQVTGEPSHCFSREELNWLQV